MQLGMAAEHRVEPAGAGTLGADAVEQAPPGEPALRRLDPAGDRVHDAPFFSSPGRMYSAPSHGLMKSNSRYSCVSFTGS